MKLDTFTKQQTALLDALARYRFLTIPLAVEHGIADRWKVGDSLKALETARLVNVAKQAKGKKEPYVYTLTPRGAKQLEEWAAEERRPRTVNIATGTFRLGPHLDQRLCTVRALMALDRWASRTGGTVEWMRAEHDPNPEGKMAHATMLEAHGIRYEPDALAEVTTPDGRTWVFALEMETGGRDSSRVDNFRAKLPDRLKAFAHEVVDDALQRPLSAPVARCLFVFETPDLLEKAQGIIADHAGDERARVFFNTLPPLAADFSAGWWNPVTEDVGDMLRAIRKPVEGVLPPTYPNPRINS